MAGEEVDDEMPSERTGEVQALVMRHISKSFDGTRALDDIDLTIKRGEVVALVGQNGSGKSTLVKVLSGYHEPEPGGELWIHGTKIALPVHVGQATEIGLSFVYQNLALAGAMTVLENLRVSARVRRGLLAWSPIWWRRERREARALLARYGVSLDLDARAADLAPVDQARLAIVRSANDLERFQSSAGARGSILVLDEPTVFLPEEDVWFLFDLIRTIVGMGASVLFISHDLAAIQEIANRIVVLRDGRKVAEAVRGELDEDELVSLIVGAVPTLGTLHARPAVDRAIGRAGRPSGPAVDETDRIGLVATRSAVPRPGETVRPGESAVSIDRLSGGRLVELSLTIGAGEIVGVAGLIGSGAEDLPYLLFGSTPATAGTLAIGADTLSIAQLTPSEAVRRRIALVPADRQQAGLGLQLEVWENIVMLIQDDHFRRGLFHRDELVKIAERAIEDFDVRPRRVDARTSSLSGGNQQKVLLAKWLLARPRLLIVHEPTQGVDVGARQDIYRFVRRAAETEAMAVLWVTTDFVELEEMCDRVVIVSRGRHAGELVGQAATKDAISAAVLRQYEEVG